MDGTEAASLGDRQRKPNYSYRRRFFALYRVVGYWHNDAEASAVDAINVQGGYVASAEETDVVIVDNYHGVKKLLN